MHRYGILFFQIVAGFVFMNALPAVAQPLPLRWEQIFDESLTPKGIGTIRWLPGGWFSELQTLESGQKQLVRIKMATGESEIVISPEKLVKDGAPLDIDDYAFSGDGRFVLLMTASEPLFRRSTRGFYFLYDLKNGRLEPLLSEPGIKISHAEVSPTADRVVYFKDNNLFVKNFEGGVPDAITVDGKLNEIINGAADWVYEEEFSFAKAWFWSPDGKFVAFYRFDESQVKLFSMPRWEIPYPQETSFKYPKAGEANATVKIGVFEVETGKTVWMDTGAETDQYIVRVNWTAESGKLAIRRMNRLQNRLDLLVADAKTGQSVVLKSEESTTWIDENDDLYFLKNRSQFLYASEEDGYNHLYLYGIDGKLQKQLTRGDWEVTQVIGYDEKKSRLFYISTSLGSTDRNLFRLDLKSGKQICLTPEPGWHSIQMAPDFTHFVDDFSSKDEPRVVRLFNGDGKLIKVLETNEGLKERLKNVVRPELEITTVPGADGSTLNAWIMRPPGFDSTKTYPLLMFVYGGPGSQQVQNRFPSGQRPLFHEFLALQGFIVACVDNRGTGARGAVFKKQVYKKLGQLEVEDQVAAARHFASKPWIDKERIGIWGWSYGGYMAGLVLAKAPELFKCAVSVAPVTDWRFYDTIYTERFMQTPALNPEGYDAGSLLKSAAHIKGRFLLIHGTADDNVHWQHSVELAEELTQHKIPFQLMYYRNRNHGIAGGNTREHLYKTMLQFFQSNL